MKILFFTIILLSTRLLSFSQIHLQLDTLQVKDTSTLCVRIILSDSLSSTFFISIPKEVKNHYHEHHTENVIIIEGFGLMRLGTKEFIVKKGDLIIIPKGTNHSVQNKGLGPLKVISIQSPFFNGSDRIKVDY